MVLEILQKSIFSFVHPLQTTRDDYETRRRWQRQGIELAKSSGRCAGRKTDEIVHARTIALRSGNTSVVETAKLAGCSQIQVKRVWAMHRAKQGAASAAHQGHSQQA